MKETQIVLILTVTLVWTGFSQRLSDHQILLAFGITQAFPRNNIAFCNQSLTQAHGNSTVFYPLLDTIPKGIKWKPGDLGTIGVQFLSGTAFAVGTSYIGLSVGGLAGFIIGVGFGSVACPTAVYLSGKWMGGNGSWFWTTASGIVVGGALWIGINFLAPFPGSEFYSAPIAACTAGIIGYHLSASPVHESIGLSSPKIKESISIGTPFRTSFRIVLMSIEL